MEPVLKMPKYEEKFWPTFQEDVEAKHPFIPADATIVDVVEEFEDSVHQNVISDVKPAVKKLPEQFSVHVVQLPSMSFLNMIKTFGP